MGQHLTHTSVGQLKRPRDAMHGACRFQRAAGLLLLLTDSLRLEQLRDYIRRPVKQVSPASDPVSPKAPPALPSAGRFPPDGCRAIIAQLHLCRPRHLSSGMLGDLDDWTQFCPVLRYLLAQRANPAGLARWACILRNCDDP